MQCFTRDEGRTKHIFILRTSIYIFDDAIFYEEQRTDGATLTPSFFVFMTGATKQLGSHATDTRRNNCLYYYGAFSRGRDNYGFQRIVITIYFNPPNLGLALSSCLAVCTRSIEHWSILPTKQMRA